MWLILNMSRSEQVFFFFFFSLDERARTHTAHCNSSWKWQAVPVREHTGDSVTCGRRSASKSLCFSTSNSASKHGVLSMMSVWNRTRTRERACSCDSAEIKTGALSCGKQGGSDRQCCFMVAQKIKEKVTICSITSCHVQTRKWNPPELMSQFDGCSLGTFGSLWVPHRCDM